MMTRALTIKRVPTVVSNYQEDNNNEDNNSERALGCTRNCLGKCCLPGMYCIKECMCFSILLYKLLIFDCFGAKSLLD